MPAPTNTSATTAIDLGALPADVTQDVHDAGTNFTVWYKFTTPAAAREIGAWGFTAIADAYAATAKPYTGPAAAPTLILGIAGLNKPIQFPVSPSTEYFLEFVKNVNTPPASLRVRVEVAPLTTPSVGNILVNDDSTGFPLVVLSHLADHTVINFVTGMPAGEAGDSLVGGVTAFEQFSDNTIRVFDIDFVQIASLAHAAGAVRIRANRGANKFYYAVDGSPVTFRTILPDGTHGSAASTMTGVPDILGVAASNDETILYYSENSAASPIKRWDIGLNVALSNLTAGFTGKFIPDILVLSDGTIVALFEAFAGGGGAIARRYTAAGALLNTYSLGTSVSPAGTFSRLAYGLDDPVSFWGWIHPTLGISRFLNIKVSDGTVLATREHTEYEGGVYDAGETATPASRFGNSFSCPFVIVQSVSTPPEPPEGPEGCPIVFPVDPSSLGACPAPTFNALG